MVRLEELAADEKSAISKPYGSAILKEDYLPNGIPVVRGVNLAGGIFLDDDFVFISEELANSMPGSRLEPGDLVFTHRGSIGQVSMIPRSPRYERYAVSTSQVKARLDQKRAVPEFYYYWFRSPQGQHSIMQGASTVGVPGLAQPVATIKSLRVPLPPIEVQSSIAATLGALDEKIKSNHRAITLEYKLATTILSKGRGRVRVGEVATVTKGLSYKGSGLDDGSSPQAVPMLNLGNFTTTGQLKDDATKYYTGDFKPGHLLGAYELVVANTDLTQARELLGRGFLVPPRLAGAIHTHHTSVVRFGNEPWMVWFLWAQLQSREFRDRAQGFATGTTVTALPHEVLLDCELRLPKDPKKILGSARSLVEHAWELEAENACLAGLRSTLLPEILSDRIRVATEMLEGAVV